MTFETILLEEVDGVATLTLNRPNALNAMNAIMFEEISRAMESVSSSSGARVLVLRGAGRAFCSGADLAKGTGANSGDGPFDAGLVLEKYLNPLMEQLASFPLPVVAAVNGVAAGAGCALALSADLLVADKSAYFLMAFTKVGLVPDAGATWLLPRLVGLSRALEMLLLAERIPAVQAEEWGMIHRAVDSAEFENVVAALAGKLAAGPTRAYAMLRIAARQGLHQSYSDALKTERANQRAAGQTADFVEGVNAFREKRPTRFSGS